MQMSNSNPTALTESSTTRPDCERRARQADRVARVMRVLCLIQLGKNYDINAIAREVGCSVRTVARDLKTLTFAGVPWYFDKASSSYRLPPKYRFPIPIRRDKGKQANECVFPRQLTRYADYFTPDDPLSKIEIHFLARWLHEHHNLSDGKDSSAVRWNQTWDLPAVVLANFYTVFMDAFKSDTAAFFKLVIEYRVVVIAVPWKTEAEFRQRDAIVCKWIQDHNLGTIVDIGTQIKKHRGFHP
jgi:hypothetical protein